MPLRPTSIQARERVFRSAFSVRDIAEPLLSCDDVIPSADAAAFMDQRSLKAIGIRHEGIVVGYAERSELEDGLCSEHVLPFSDDIVLSDTARLAEVVMGLHESPRLFVSVFGQVSGIVTRSDLQKPPVRMWLFGMITILEMRITNMIDQYTSKDEWANWLSDARIAKAVELQAERRRRGQDPRLIDCLQLGDKAQIVARNEPLRTMAHFESRRQVESVTKGLERLRNNLAHSQDIITSDWDAVVDLCENLDQMIENPLNL